MTPQQFPDHVRLKSLPTQIIEVSDAIILKRGCTELKITGQGAKEALSVIFECTIGGDADKSEICKKFDEMDRVAIGNMVDQLCHRKLLIPVEGNPTSTTLESSLNIFYWHFGKSETEVSGSLGTRRIAILGVNCISRKLVASLKAFPTGDIDLIDYPVLRNMRLFDDCGKLKPEEWQTDLPPHIDYDKWSSSTNSFHYDCIIATSDFGRHDSLREWNNFCVESKRIFFPIVLHNLIGYVGPLVIPGETACYECLHARVNSQVENVEIQRSIESSAFEGQVIVGFHPSMASVLAEIASFELARFFSQAIPKQNIGKLIEVNLLATEVKARKVLKIPRCGGCSPLLSRSSATPLKDPFANATKTEL